MAMGIHIRKRSCFKSANCLDPRKWVVYNRRRSDDRIVIPRNLRPMQHTVRMSGKVRASFIPPMLLLKTETLPSGEDWLYELKIDGFRNRNASRHPLRLDCLL
jgi:ATP-dependent DNA ligase